MKTSTTVAANRAAPGAWPLIAVIAENAWREAVRDRILLAVLLFALLMVGAGLLFAQMSFGIVVTALINFSLVAMTLLGAGLAIFLGNQLVSREIERRTLHTLLAHPVRRWQFVVGKYAGLLLALAVTCGLMLLALLAALTVVQRGVVAGESAVLVAAWMLLLQLALLTAVSLLFSSFSSPLLAALFSTALFLIGHFNQDLRGLGENAHQPAGRLTALALARLLPDFGDLNGVTAASHFQPLPAGLVLARTLYVVAYGAALLVATSLILERRDLT